MIYLDNSATTKPAPEVVKAMTAVLTEDFGNPSTLYSLGLSAEKLVKAARSSVAKSIGASDQEVYFTSGGTESDNAAIFGAWEARKKQGKRIITTAVEHPAVLKCFEALKAKGADVVILPVDADCAISLDDLKEALTEDTILVSVMRVNNETGAIFPVPDIARILSEFAKEKGIAKPLFHSDCVQSYGKMRTDVSALGVDMLSI
ncbi:MAG: aminotransferase class V-fold PLP-dependent enzyme, partial [Firmicutes bacterium]|nr:aminotransferase class V-fold PLP-dependent enzyme [Bacillota bacterium]